MSAPPDNTSPPPYELASDPTKYSAVPPPQPYAPYQPQQSNFPPPPIHQQPMPNNYASPSPVPNMPPHPMPATINVLRLGPRPMSMACPNCNQPVVTRTTPNAGLLTFLLSLGLVLIGCFMGCCLIPFCIEDCQDIHHFCPNCNAFIGVYKRM
uniref:LITAF domain-containing protein n=1 Tax=Steinernema glaseri TaxID=37863 RepID=A0A1I7Y716_9BILA